MRIRYNRPIKASSDDRKWVNTELTQNEWSQLRPYLIKNGYKFEPSGAGDMVHIECYLNDAEINKVDKFIDTIADDIGASCRSKSSVKSSTSKHRAVKAEYRDNTIDKDAVRELVLTITNDGDLYRRQITPAIDNLKRKYKKGNYDRDKAVRLWQYVADEGVRRYNKEFGSGTYSVAWLNPITRKAIAEELRDYYEDEIMYEDNVESACGKRSVNASYGDDDIVMYWDGQKVYEGPIMRDFVEKVNWFLDDPEKLQQIVDYCNSFGDPVIEDISDTFDVASTFAEVVSYEINEANVMDDDVYVSDELGHFEIFPKSQEIEGSVSRSVVKADSFLRSTRKSDDGTFSYTVDTDKLYLGVPGAYFIWKGEWSDPWVEYDGGVYNASDLDSGVYSDFEEYCKENGITFSDWRDEDNAFDEWAKENGRDSAEGWLYDMSPFAEVIETSGDYRWAKEIGVNASTKRRRNTQSVKASEVDELEDDPFINALWEACDDVPQLVEINYEATEGIIFIFNHTTDDYEAREASLINSLEAAGYDAEYLANNGSNVIVLDVKEKGVNASTTSRRAVKASSDPSRGQFRTEFQKFLGKIDREVSDLLYQYDDAIWNIKGTISYDENAYWCELNLWCDDEEAGTVNIEYDGSNFHTDTEGLVVSIPDSDTVQAEGKSFDDIYEACVGELLRLAEDYVNSVR